VALAVDARKKLLDQKVKARVVSMPSWELFEVQPQGTREAVFPSAVKRRLAIEAGIPQGWHRYVGDGGDVMGLDHFGASAPGGVVMREFGFTVENVCQRAMALFRRG
jgi:transketolase